MAGVNGLQLDQIRDEPFVLFNRNEARGLFDEIIHVCHEHGFVPDVLNQPKAKQTVLTEVASGLGVSVVSSLSGGCMAKGVFVFRYKV